MTKKQERGLILLLGAIAAMGPFTIDTYLPGFPAIAEDLDTEISMVSLTLTSYFIGISIGQLIYGPLLDRYGRKKPLLFGLSLYLLAAVGCALAFDVYWLIGIRLIQALGGCAGMVAARAIVRDRFPVQETARVFSTLILVMGVAPIVAPTLGGYITANLGWRYIFMMLAVFAMILVVMVHYLLKESKVPDKEVSLRPKRIAINYWKVFTNRDFLIYSFAGSMAMAGMFTYIAGSPFVIMEILGFAEDTYGWIFGLNAAGFIIGSQINRVVLRKRDSGQVTDVSGILILLICVALVVQVAIGIPNAYTFLFSLFTFLFFLGFLNPNSTALALGPFSNNAGVASALIGSVRMVGAAVSTALIGALHDGTAFPMVGIMLGCALIVFALLFGSKLLPQKELSYSEG